MRQVLLIFRKDCRHFWPEISVSLALALAFAWMYPFTWETGHVEVALSGHAYLDRNHLKILANVITFLLPVSWLVLIARAVQDESLVGTRQFWRTRPFTWQMLLAAKSLFVFATVYVPLIVAEAILLMRFGFHPLDYLPNLFYNLVALSMVFILPMLILAATMSSVLRIIMLLLVLTAVGCVIGFFASSGSDLPSMQLPSDGDLFPLCGLLAFLILALIIQFATRRLWLTRGLLLTAVGFIVVAVQSPWNASLFPGVYPALTSNDTLPLRILPQAKDWLVTGSGLSGKTLHLDLPVSFLGIQGGKAYQVENIRVVLSTPDGTQWASDWRATYNLRFTPDQPGGTVPVDLVGKIPKSMRSQPVKYQVSLALAEIVVGPHNLLKLPEDGGLNVAGFGRCLLPDETLLRHYQLDCRLPFHEPYLTEVVVPLTLGDCEDPTAAAAKHSLLHRWVGSLEPDPADPFLDSVRQERIDFHDPNLLTSTGTSVSDLTASPPPEITGNICSGSPILFQPYHLARRFSYFFDFEGTPFSTPPASPQGNAAPEKAS